MRIHATVLSMAVLLSACGAARPGVGFGTYEPYQPVLEPSFENITLGAPANVAVFRVLTPMESGHIVLFQPSYPLYDTDQLRFEAGAHRLAPRQRTAAAPPRCQPNVAPTLAGCRPHLPDYPGVNTPNIGTQYYSTSWRVMIASDEPIDPYGLTEFLIARGRTDTNLVAALNGNDITIVQRELERVLRDRLGSTGWAAYVRPQS